MGCVLSILGIDNNNTEETKKQTTKPEGNDLVILRIKRSRDKIKKKRNGLEKNIEKCTKKIIALKKENNKESAVYYLGKRRTLKQNLKNIDGKLNLLENRINKIEDVLDDVEFTDTLRESNDLLKDLMEEVDLDSIREAGDLDKEINFNNEEIQNLINSNMQDEELLGEFEKLGEEDKIGDVKKIERKVVVQKVEDVEEGGVNEPLLA